MSPSSITKAVKTLSVIIFCTIEHGSSSDIASIFRFITNSVIAIAVFAYILSTESNFQYTPATCKNPTCDRDPIRCPGTTVCEPRQYHVFTAIDQFVVIYFTLEYGLKFVTVWSVSPRIARILPSSWVEEHGLQNDLAPQPKYSSVSKMVRYLCTYDSFIDLASIIPFYAILAADSSMSSGFVRSLRLLRVFRIMKMFRVKTFQQSDLAYAIIRSVLNESSLLLMTFGFFAMILLIVMGSLIYTAEQGTFVVNADNPDGAYVTLLRAEDATSLSPSSYTSVGIGIYWAISLIPGAQEFNPRTVAGRAISNLLSLFTSMGLAFPFGIIENELYRTKKKRFVQLMNQVARDEKSLLAEINRALGPMGRRLLTLPPFPHWLPFRNAAEVDDEDDYEYEVSVDSQGNEEVDKGPLAPVVGVAVPVGEGLDGVQAAGAEADADAEESDAASDPVSVAVSVSVLAPVLVPVSTHESIPVPPPAPGPQQLAKYPYQSASDLSDKGKTTVDATSRSPSPATAATPATPATAGTTVTAARVSGQLTTLVWSTQTGLHHAQQRLAEAHEAVAQAALSVRRQEDKLRQLEALRGHVMGRRVPSVTSGIRS